MSGESNGREHLALGLTKDRDDGGECKRVPSRTLEDRLELVTIGTGSTVTSRCYGDDLGGDGGRLFFLVWFFLDRACIIGCVIDCVLDGGCIVVYSYGSGPSEVILRRICLSTSTYSTCPCK